MKRVVVALAEARPREHRRVTRARDGSQEAVVLDFIEDDLLECRRALGAIDDHLGRIGAALNDPRSGRHQLLVLARYFRPAQEIEYLEATLGRLRRRLAQVSERLAAPRGAPASTP